MYAPKTVTGTFNTPAGEVFAALKEVASTKPYKDAVADDAASAVAFMHGKTMWSFGYEFVARVTETATGAEVTIVAGGVDGARRAMLDGAKHAKAANNALEALRASLPG